MTTQEKYNKRMKLRSSRPKVHIAIIKNDLSRSTVSGKELIHRLKAHARIGKMKGAL